MLTLFILSQWTKVYSKVSINLLRMLQNQLASAFQSRVLAARQAGVLLSVPPDSCIPVLPWALPLPLFLPVVLMFPSVGISKQGLLEGKGATVPQASPHFCVPWVVQGCSPKLQARLAPLRVCDLHQYLLFRLFPHPPDVLAPWIGHAFGAVPL